MKVLFVCKGNVARSQMAEVFYNHITHSNDAGSAGIEADHEGKTLAQRLEIIGRQSNSMTVMKELGFDMSTNRQKLVKQNMLGKYDKVINMCDETIVPSWLKQSPKYIYWDITDPYMHDINFTRDIRDQIRERVHELATANDANHEKNND